MDSSGESRHPYFCRYGSLLLTSFGRTDKYIYMYFDNRLTQVLYTKFHADQTLWQKGGFSEKSENDTLLADPWSNTTSTTGNAPFDQEFYLVLNVAVGARNGWFE